MPCATSPHLEQAEHKAGTVCYPVHPVVAQIVPGLLIAHPVFLHPCSLEKSPGPKRDETVFS